MADWDLLESAALATQHELARISKHIRNAAILWPATAQKTDVFLNGAARVRSPARHYETDDALILYAPREGDNGDKEPEGKHVEMVRLCAMALVQIPGIFMLIESLLACLPKRCSCSKSGACMCTL